MIASLRGTVLEKKPESVVLEAAGVGYTISVTAATSAALPSVGQSAFLHIAESVGMYGGGVTLYGFFNTIDKDMFLTFRDCVPSTGAKKALEYLEKASKSLPDFRRAILEKDAKVLSGVFGFTRKTAERLIDSLKTEMEKVNLPGVERLIQAGGTAAGAYGAGATAMNRALSALSALGYKPAEARSALASVAEEHPGEALDAESIIRIALKRL